MAQTTVKPPRVIIPLKPAWRKLFIALKDFPKTYLMYEALANAIGESKIPFSPAEIDGLWHDKPVRIYVATDERVIFNIYDPVKKTWIPAVLPAEEFYPFFTPLNEINAPPDEWEKIARNIWMWKLRKRRWIEKQIHHEEKKTPEQELADRIWEDFFLDENLAKLEETQAQIQLGKKIHEQPIRILFNNIFNSYITKLDKWINEITRRYGSSHPAVKILRNAKQYMETMKKIHHPSLETLNAIIDTVLGLISKAMNTIYTPKNRNNNKKRR